MHVEEPLGPRLAGLHDSEDTSTGATRLTIELAELLLNVAVIVALEFMLKDPAVALNVVEVAAAATVTEPGTASVRLLLEIPTTAPPVGAA